MKEVKDTTFKIRFSQLDRAKLEFCVNQTGKNKSDIIREGIDKVFKSIKKDKLSAGN